MKKRNITTTALLVLAVTGIQAQTARQAPRLVVNIVIDQLTTDYIEKASDYFGTEGFKKLMAQGVVYQNAQYPFTPIDRASAVCSVMTGTTPYYNGIIGTQWLDRNTLRLCGCTDDNAYPGIYTTDRTSPKNILTSTLTDELKIATNGKGIVYSISKQKDAAILSAGHAADGALWKDLYNGSWCTSTYYMKSAPEWLTQYNQQETVSKKNKTEFQEITELTNLAILCIERTGMGVDNDTDMLNITLDASTNTQQKKGVTWEEEITKTYINLDRQIADLVATIENKVGSGNVVFYITSTGYVDEPTDAYEVYRVPTGTFHINRTANLLNMYLGALHGSEKYVEGCSRNQIYLNTKLIEQKRLKYSDILNNSQSFLLQCEGVRNAHTSESLLKATNSETTKIRNGFSPESSGNIVVEVAPGWILVKDDTQESYHVDARVPHFPIIIYGQGIRAEKISTPVTTDQIAPTIANHIHIRAPNACSSLPLR